MMPPGYQGSLVFRELLFLLRNALVELGHDCTIAPNQLAEDRINIIIGYHLLNYGDYLKQYRYIPFQLEQLDINSVWYSDNARQILASAEAVWDFSEVNIEFLKQEGVQAHHVAIGYNKDLEIIPESENKDIEVLFYGSINERRKVLLEALSEKVNLVVLAGKYGKERDEVIARSKILLNMHFYETKILESVRISYLLNNGIFVITEDSADNPYAEIDLVSCPYGKLIETCVHYINNPSEVGKIAELNHQQFKQNYQMSEILRPIVTK